MRKIVDYDTAYGRTRQELSSSVSEIVREGRWEPFEAVWKDGNDYCQTLVRYDY